METPKQRNHVKIPIDVMDAIYNRHATRNFLPEKIDSDIIKQLLDAAIHAPSALHEESRGFVIIQNKNLLDRISESAKLIINKSDNKKTIQSQHISEVTKQKEFNVFYNAHTLIVIYSTFKGPFVSADCWLAAQNLMLAALPFGLQSCVIGFAVAALNMPEWKKELGIPAKMTAVAPIIIGWPNGKTLPTTHEEPLILKWT
jgi:nitroreductase